MPKCRLVASLALALLASSCSDDTPATPGAETAVGPAGAPALGAGPLGASSVLLVTLDTTRADALGCYGAPDWVSPTIDALATMGVRFTQARTTCPVTLPAHASILTGLYPFEHGVRDNATFVLAEDVETLPERLSAAGWSTAAVAGAFVVHSDFGLDQGFDIYSDVPRRRLELDVVEDQRDAAEVVDEALSLVESGRLEPPFFLWVHMFDPHRPLDAPQPMKDLALQGRQPAELSFPEAEQLAYLAEVAYCDRELARLLKGLEQVVPRDELLVAIVSDHGEGFGQHGEEAHGLQLFDTTMRVPLVLYHPRIPDSVVRAPVSTIDLAPTIHGLLGLGELSGPGRDLSPVLFGEAEAAGRTLYFETAHPFYSYGWSPLYGMLSGTTKVVEGPRPEVYDLADDPEELHDVYSNRDQVHARVRGMFPALAERTRTSQRIALEGDDRTRLLQLGYVDDVADEEATNRLLPGTLDPTLLDPREGMPTKILCQRAVSYAARGEHEAAVEDIREVLRRDPDNPFFLSQAGAIFIDSGRHEEALEVLNRSVSQREDPGARCSQAIALNLLGRLDESIEVLRQNRDLHPRHLHTRFALGELLLQRAGEGDAFEAEQQFEAFLTEHSEEDAWHHRAVELRTAARAAR